MGSRLPVVIQDLVLILVSVGRAGFQDSQASQVIVGFQVPRAIQATVVRGYQDLVVSRDWMALLPRQVIRDIAVSLGIQGFHLPADLVVSVVRVSADILASVGSRGIRDSLERERADSRDSVVAQATQVSQVSQVIADSVRSRGTRDLVEQQD